MCLVGVSMDTPNPPKNNLISYILKGVKFAETPKINSLIDGHSYFIYLDPPL